MCVCTVCVYVCIHVMRVVRLRHKPTYCFFPFSWVANPLGGGATGPEDGIIYIWHSPEQPHPPPPRMVMVPCPAPCGSGWGGCGWVGMLVDGVAVFANDVASYGICKELYLVRE